MRHVKSVTVQAPARAMMGMGGMKGGMARDILMYNKERVFAFVLALGYAGWSAGQLESERSSEDLVLRCRIADYVADDDSVEAEVDEGHGELQWSMVGANSSLPGRGVCYEGGRYCQVALECCGS